jgi:hypothetical protein
MINFPLHSLGIDEIIVFVLTNGGFQVVLKRGTVFAQIVEQTNKFPALGSPIFPANVLAREATSKRWRDRL